MNPQSPRSPAVQQEIALLRMRLSKAHADQEAWRASGSQEKYLEAYCLAESLEGELVKLEMQGRHVSSSTG
jgi:hypothetical protein